MIDLPTQATLHYCPCGALTPVDGDLPDGCAGCGTPLAPTAIVVGGDPTDPIFAQQALVRCAVFERALPGSTRATLGLLAVLSEAEASPIFTLTATDPRAAARGEWTLVLVDDASEEPWLLRGPLRMQGSRRAGAQLADCLRRDMDTIRLLTKIPPPRGRTRGRGAPQDHPDAGGTRLDEDDG